MTKPKRSIAQRSEKINLIENTLAQIWVEDIKHNRVGIDTIKDLYRNTRNPATLHQSKLVLRYFKMIENET